MIMRMAITLTNKLHVTKLQAHIHTVSTFSSSRLALIQCISCKYYRLLIEAFLNAPDRQNKGQWPMGRNHSQNN
jgi:hypothetical protein